MGHKHLKTLKSRIRKTVTFSFEWCCFEQAKKKLLRVMNKTKTKTSIISNRSCKSRDQPSIQNKKAWMGLEPQPYRLTVIQLCQLSYQVTTNEANALREIRTPNLSLIKGLLYRLSYQGELSRT
jgi:hypothetical protein